MFIIKDNILLNPLNIESVQFIESKLLINEKQSGATMKITMASGVVYEMEPGYFTDINLSMQELIFQIDMACGMKFEPNAKEETPPDVVPS